MTRPKSAASTSPTLPTWVGVRPRVWVGPRAEKKGVLYLRWWGGKNWKYKSLGFSLLEQPDAAARKAKTLEAYQAALDQFERLTGRKAPSAGKAYRPLRLSETWAIVTDPRHGRFPSDSVYRREIKKALEVAAKVLGEDFPWTAFDRGRLREVTRRHADAVMSRGGVGFRAAHVVGARLITIAHLLKDEGLLPSDYVVPGGKSWIPELKTYCETKRGDVIPAPHRPRYTLEEFRQLLAVAPQVDPRFGLMTALGFELRAGQVSRARRSHLDIDRGRFEVHGRGKKAGTTLDLTLDQMESLGAATGGYLLPCEILYLKDGTDYVLFPSRLGPKQIAVPGHMELVDRQQVKKWMREAEVLAGITHVDGRSWYGGRRVAVDAAFDEGAGGEEVQAMGGWKNRRMVDEVYSDRERDGVRSRTKELRAKVRGETVAEMARPATPQRDALVQLATELQSEAAGSYQPADVAHRLTAIADRLLTLATELTS